MPKLFKNKQLSLVLCGGASYFKFKGYSNVNCNR